ncbi:hypothetical protein Scep_004372 [Stephania cephalantha]|uniref:Uncharacterized protein n=1 Tax=Stephania cephalantha TaxID=152367 RepID=A0AAP0KSC5_9MAGN
MHLHEARRNHGYVDTLPRVSRWDVKMEQGLNVEYGQRIRRALDKCRSNMRVRQAVDVIKAWKALPPRESDKAAVVKMADEALKLLTIFGSPTPLPTQ